VLCCTQLLYLIYGAKQVLERSCCNLERRLELYLDGVKAELPEVESIVILNIPSWGAGVRLWDMLDDGEYYLLVHTHL